jgi:hypothetical protein
MSAMMHSSPQERRTMGNLARLHVEQSFSLEAMLDRWEKHYRRLLASSYHASQEVRDPITAKHFASLADPRTIRLCSWLGPRPHSDFETCSEGASGPAWPEHATAPTLREPVQAG